MLAVVHAAAQTVTASFEVDRPTSHDLLVAIVLGVVVGIAAVWAAVDTWLDVSGRQAGWLIAALIAGWGAGVLGVIGRGVFVDQTGVGDLGEALTGGAAFTALLVLAPAGVGLLVGRFLRAGPRAEVAEPDEHAEPEDDEDEPAQRGGGSKSGPRG